MAVSYKCPGCAASLFFDADQQMMTCEFCGASISPHDLASPEAVLQESLLDAENQRDAAISQGGIQAQQAEAEPDSAQSNSEELFSEAETIQFVCDSCGAKVITDINTSATFCTFCGSPTMISERLVDVRKPDFIIPFKYGKKEAVKKFFKWCSAGRMTPISFVKNENIEKITGIYVPFWLYDVDAKMNITAEGTLTTTVTVGNKVTTTTSYYDILRHQKICWDRIPYDGASDFDDELVEMVEPYEYSEILPFNMSYLSGFFANRYDVSSDSHNKKVYNRVTKFIAEIFKSSTKKYKTLSIKQDDSTAEIVNVKYALMPFWFLNYKYAGKTYTFAMNGQTGKVAGSPPISRVKLFLIFLGLLPVCAALVHFVLSFIVMGGFY
ncbi:MAG: hypothetical protein GXY06_03165 [Clostridiaceae bacterium]|nr:hypothetical protein [Clostridiaceae bacterium]